MKIALFGATGQTGLLLLDKLLPAGHEVTALVRNPTKMERTNANLHLIKGDALNATDVAGAVVGQDVAISVLGARSLKPDTICQDSARNIIAGLKASGGRRFICISGAGLNDNAGFIIQRVALPLLLKNVYADALAQDTLIQQSDLDWTIVRPYRLTTGAATTTYKVAAQPFRSPIIVRLTSRADVADFMAKEATQNRYIKKIAFVSTRGI